MVNHDSIYKVSIIVPAYNVEQYIGKCLDSLIGQTYKNIEIILVDDGSSDSTGDICDTYQQQYGNLIKVEHCRHRGVSQRRLTGIRRASGEYVVFVDADDWVENDYIVSMLSCMESADIVAAGISRELFDEKESIVFEYNGFSAGVFVSDIERKELYEKMLYYESPYCFGVLPYMCNKMFRKDVMQVLLEKLDKRIFDGEDAALVYQYLLTSQKIVLIDECKYHYVIHRGSASFRDSEDSYLNAAYLYQELYACFVKNKYHASLLKQLDYYMRRMIWKKSPAQYLQVNSFVFPCNKVEQGSAIILYGMGKVGDVFYRQICQTNYVSIIAWADRAPKQIEDISITVPRITPDEIKDYCFDYVVIAIENKIIVREILEKLMILGIEEKKIVIPDFAMGEFKRCGTGTIYCKKS